MASISVLFGGLIVPFLVLETICRFLPVSDRVEFMPVDDRHPYLHAKPDQVYHLTQGNLFQIQTVKRTNNEGFFCDLDLNPQDTFPRVAVIGDSFVEALQVANSESVHARLDRLLPSHWNVFGIGSSGSALPQYLAYARYAMDKIKPKALVFVIYQNDFIESFGGTSPVKGHHYFITDGRTVRFNRTEESLLRRMLFKSAFFRYLWLNVKLPRFFQRKTSGSSVTQKRKSDDLTLMATRKFISELKMTAGDLPIWIITDAVRPAVYNLQPADTLNNHPISRRYARLRSEASQAGFHTIDLNPVFHGDFLLHHQRFEFPTDGHWNAHGHRLAAEALSAAMIPVLNKGVKPISNTGNLSIFLK